MSEAPVHIAADVLVIGAGGAGMYAALAAAEAGAERIVLADRNVVGRGGATVMAQMTVAAALGEAEPDSVDEHLEDTLVAFRLPAYDPKLRVRERKHPKLYWIDPGMARAAAGRSTSSR